VAGERLKRMPHSSLRMRDDQVVAAGSCGLNLQVENMRSIGMSDDEITLILCENPRRALSIS